MEIRAVGYVVWKGLKRWLQLYAPNLLSESTRPVRPGQISRCRLHVVRIDEVLRNQRNV